MEALTLNQPPRDIIKTDPVPALFLDRDGVINVDRKFVCEIRDFEFIPGIASAIRRFNERGWRIIVVTNQTGIAFGYYTEVQMQILHVHMTAQLQLQGAQIDAIYHCPFHADGSVEAYRKDSELRKPRPGMLQKAMERFPIDKASSFLVGDKDTDIAAAEAAGIKGFLFQGGDVDQFIEQAWEQIQSAS